MKNLKKSHICFLIWSLYCLVSGIIQQQIEALYVWIVTTAVFLLAVLLKKYIPKNVHTALSKSDNETEKALAIKEEKMESQNCKNNSATNAFTYKPKNNKNASIKIKKNDSSTTSDAVTKKNINLEYQKTIFLYAQSKRSFKNKDSYPKYILYELKITDPLSFRKSLIDQGYLNTVQVSITEVLKCMSLPELKKILEENHLKKTGNKPELINRILSFASEKAILDISKKGEFYELSEKGKKFLLKNNDYIKLHEHSSWEITLEQFDKAKKELPFNANFHDVAWSIFNSRLIKTPVYESRSTYLHMHQLTSDEGNLEKALYYLLIVIYLDVSGTEWYDHVISYYDGLYTKKDLIKLSESLLFPTYSIEKIKHYKDYYDPLIVDEIYSLYQLPYTACPIALLKQIIDDSLDDKPLDSEYYSKKISDNFKNIIKNL